MIPNRDGTITIENESDQVARLTRLEHLADVRSCSKVFVEDLTNGRYVKKIYDINPTDVSHLIPFEPTNDDECHTKDITVDPDEQLSPVWRQKFVDLCEEYSDIINPRPGRYNGFYGRIDNSINFSSVPPPTMSPPSKLLLRHAQNHGGQDG